MDQRKFTRDPRTPIALQERRHAQMTTIAIIQRELTVAGRRASTFWSRCVAAALMSALAAVYLGFSGNTTSAALPREIFTLLTWVTFTGALSSGIFLTADALSSERREGTLGLLFLTDLNGLDIAIGKLVASSIQGAYALIGVLPVLAVPLMMGGVPGREFWFTTLALTSILIASLGIGILASAVSRDSAQAVGLTLLIVAALCNLPLLVQWMVVPFGAPPGPTGWILILSPVATVNLARSSLVLTTTHYPLFQGALLVHGIYGLGGLAVAAGWLTRHWRAIGLESGGPIRKPRLQKAAEAGTGPLVQPGTRLDGNPYQWISGRRLRFTPALRWLSGAGLVAWAGFYSFSFILPNNSAVICFVTAMFIAYGLHAVYKVQTTLLATSRLAEEAADGGLELLLSTPLAIQDLIQGHRQAVGRAMQTHRRSLTLVNLCLLFSVLNPKLGISGHEISSFLTIFLGGLALLWIDTYAIVRLGAWSAVRTRRSSRALWHTLLPTFLPTPIGVLSLMLIAKHNVPSDHTYRFFLALFLALILCALIFGHRAGSRLAANFRSYAAGSGR